MQCDQFSQFRFTKNTKVFTIAACARFIANDNRFIYSRKDYIAGHNVWINYFW